MNFNVVGSLLAVSSAHDTVHIFKLGRREGGEKGLERDRDQGSVTSISSPPESVDGTAGGPDGGYEAFIEKKKGSGVGCVPLTKGVVHVYSSILSSSLKRKSMQMTKSLTNSMGGYLPNTITEMWEPSRDFAFLRLPTTGARTIVALSGLVFSITESIIISEALYRTMPQVMVLSSEGYLYLYNIDLDNGGECSLIKQYKYVASEDPI